MYLLNVYSVFKVREVFALTNQLGTFFGNNKENFKKINCDFWKSLQSCGFRLFSGFLLCSNTAKNQQKINRLSKINSPTDWTGYIFRLIGEAVLMWKYMCMCCVYLQYQQYQKTKRIIYNLVYVICSSFRDCFLSSIWYTVQVPPKYLWYYSSTETAFCKEVKRFKIRTEDRENNAIKIIV